MTNSCPSKAVLYSHTYMDESKVILFTDTLYIYSKDSYCLVELPYLHTHTNLNTGEEIYTDYLRDYLVFKNGKNTGTFVKTFPLSSKQNIFTVSVDSVLNTKGRYIAKRDLTDDFTLVSKTRSREDYLLKDTTNKEGAPDKISLFFDDKLKHIDYFTLGRLFDSTRNSKLSGMLFICEKKRTTDIAYGIFEMKEIPVKNPAKIDSIFAKLIPYLPKK